MQSREIKKWQDEEALKRYRMIAPLLDEELDEAKRRQMREEIAAKNEISVRSLYRYEASYKAEAFSGLRPMNREKRRSQALPDNWDEIVGEAIQLIRGISGGQALRFSADRRCQRKTEIRCRQAAFCRCYGRSGMWEINSDKDVWGKSSER